MRSLWRGGSKRAPALREGHFEDGRREQRLPHFSLRQMHEERGQGRAQVSAKNSEAQHHGQTSKSLSFSFLFHVLKMNISDTCVSDKLGEESGEDEVEDEKVLEGHAWLFRCIRRRRRQPRRPEGSPGARQESFRLIP